MSQTLLFGDGLQTFASSISQGGVIQSFLLNCKEM